MNSILMSLCSQRLLLSGLIMLAITGSASATVVSPWLHESYVESFQEGLDHPELVTLQNAISFQDGAAHLEAGGVLRIENPDTQIAWRGRDHHPFFVGMAMQAYDPATLDSSFEISIGGTIADCGHPSPERIVIEASGLLLTVDWLARGEETSMQFDREAGVLELHYEPYNGLRLDLAGVSHYLGQNPMPMNLVEHIEFSGNGLILEEFTIDPWWAVAIENERWGQLKARF